MSRIKPILLGVLVMSCSAATTSASAHEYITRFLPERATGLSGISKIKGEILEHAITIECGNDVFGDTLEVSGASSKGIMIFESCVVSGLVTCGVPSFEFKFNDLLVGPEPGVEEEIKPASGTTLGTVTINTCALRGKYKVEGTQLCRLPEAGVIKTTHILECVPSGSHLNFDGKPATFTGTEEATLRSEELWVIK